jgi:hypothetical protein
VFVYLPIWAFTQLNEDAPEHPISSILGILYFSGYFGGQWLRIRLSNRPLNIPPAFLTPGLRANITLALEAAVGEDPVGYVRGQVGAAVDSFGYNSGYFRTILDNPPEGVERNPMWEFEYEEDEALSTRFETPQLREALRDFQRWFKQLNHKQIYESAKNTYIQIQAIAYQRGVATWSGPLSVQGFSESDYNLLLEASSGFLEIARLNALTLTESALQCENIPLARDAAFMNGAYITFTGSYVVGLLNGANDNIVPFPFPELIITG